MRSGQAAAFLLFAVAAAGTPGPSNLLLTSIGAHAGVARGLPALFGVTVGMGVMLFAAAFGLGSAVLAHPAALRSLRWMGAALLLWLSWKIASAGRSEAATGGRPVGFAGAAALQWVNPKSWLVCAAAVGTYLDPDSGGALAQALAIGGLFVLAALPCCFAWLAFGAAAQRLLRTDGARRAFQLAMGALLAASVVLIVR